MRKRSWRLGLGLGLGGGDGLAKDAVLGEVLVLCDVLSAS